MTRTFTPADTLHRLVKEALDSGAAVSLAEAEATDVCTGLAQEPARAKLKEDSIGQFTSVADLQASA